jgi:hypothetical protein
LDTAHQYLVDLKTCKNITAKEFGRDFYRYHYDCKLGLYQRWMQKITKRPWAVKIICLEKQPPWDTAVVPIPDAVLDRGVSKMLKLIPQLRDCIYTGNWPGVANGGEYYLDTPTWEMDEDMELEGAEDYEVAA